MLKYREKPAASRWALSLQFSDFERNTRTIISKHQADLFRSSFLTSFLLIWYLKLCSRDPEDPGLDSLEWNPCYLNPPFPYSQAADSRGAWPCFPKPAAGQTDGCTDTRWVKVPRYREDKLCGLESCCVRLDQKHNFEANLLVDLSRCILVCIPRIPQSTQLIPYAPNSIGWCASGVHIPC